jgi:hypothetical protein
MKNLRNMSKRDLGILILLVVFVGSGLILAFRNNLFNKENTPIVKEGAEDANSNLLKFSNDKYKFEFKYPKDLEVVLTSINGEECGGDWDKMVIKNKASGEVLLQANSGKSCIGEVTNVQTADVKLATASGKTVHSSSDNDLDPKTNTRYVNYYFGDFSAWPTGNRANEVVLDEIFKTFTVATK